MSASCLFCVLTFMPAATGVVQEAGNPFIPSICTRHRRHDPNASNCSVAQSLGIFTSVSAAARITDVPAGTVTSWPSMVRVTSSVLSRFGVPRSFSTMDNMIGPRLPLTRRAGCSYRFDEIFREMVQRRNHGVGRQAAQGAQRPVGQGFAEVTQNRFLLDRILSGDQPVDDFHPAGGADAAGRALAAGLDGAEFHGIARL